MINSIDSKIIFTTFINELGFLLLNLNHPKKFITYKFVRH